MSDEAILKLSAKLEDIESRLSSIENQLKASSPKQIDEVRLADVKPKKPASEEANLENASISSQTAHLQAFHELRKREQSQQKQSDSTQDRQQSGKWLGAIGVLCFILASVFFVKLAIDAGWLTPIRQLACLVSFGFSLIVTGFHLRSSDSRYASMLPAAGIIVLYVAAYSGHLYFSVYGIFAAAIIVSAISVLALYLFKEFENDFYLITAAIGSYLVPLLLKLNTAAFITVSFYYLSWDVVFCAAAIMLRLRGVITLSAYLALLTFALIYQTGLHGFEVKGRETWIVLIQFLQFAIFSVSTAAFSVINRQKLSSLEAWNLFPVCVVFYGLEYSLLHSLNQDLAPWIALIFAALIFALYISAKKALGSAILESSPMIATFITLIAVHAIYFEITPKSGGAWIGLAVIGALFFLSSKLNYGRYWPLFLILGVVPVIEYYKVLGLGEDYYSNFETILFGIVYSAALFWIYVNKRRMEGIALLSLAHAELLLVSTLREVSISLLDGDSSRFLTSGLWAAAALLILSFAYRLRDTMLARSAVVIFAIVSVKLLFFDLTVSSGLARVIALLVIGALLYAGGMLLRRINNWGSAS